MTEACVDLGLEDGLGVSAVRCRSGRRCGMAHTSRTAQVVYRSPISVNVKSWEGSGARTASRCKMRLSASASPAMSWRRFQCSPHGPGTAYPVPPGASSDARCSRPGTCRDVPQQRRRTRIRSWRRQGSCSVTRKKGRRHRASRSGGSAGADVRCNGDARTRARCRYTGATRPYGPPPRRRPRRSSTSSAIGPKGPASWTRAF